MTVIGIRYLTGYAVAAESPGSDPEWPPHPGRVFMALAAAHFESTADAGERRALQWIERQPSPAIRASAANGRSLVETYVPANDQRSHDAIESRSRQARSFPRTRPDEDTAFLLWASDPDADTRDALAKLCAKVTRIGHSSSLVQVWLADSDQSPDATWFPGDGIHTRRLRVTGEGTLSYLEQTFGDDGGNSGKRPRPKLNLWQGYSQKDLLPPPAKSDNGPFDPDFIILRVDKGMPLGLASTLQLTGALRNAAMKAAGENPPDWITGHTAAGTPLQAPHAAFFPLPFVGHPHADGHVMGLAIALPHALTNSHEGQTDLRARLGPLLFHSGTGERRQVHLWRDGKSLRNEAPDRVWDWMLEREIREAPPFTLRATTWAGPSRVWASVTPVVLHHHPKKRDGDVERILLEAFDSALLPRPEKLEVRSASAHEGSGHARSVPSFDEGGAGLCRYQTHVVAQFGSPVQGPVLVGRGRYRGYGLFAPLMEKR